MWPVIGQDRIVDLLKRSIAEGRLSHAYLLLGPRHVGKMTLALSLARALNCTSEDSPCGECSSCRRISGGNHPDVLLIQLDETAPEQLSRKAIGIDQIREMQRSVNLNSYEGGYRIVIIDGAEYMSEGAANSLLKTLEEPPPNTVFLLLTAEEDMLLPTIHSRCQRIEFEPIPINILQKVLIEQWGVPPDQADLLARFSCGCIGWAISALSEESIQEERSEQLGKLISLIYSDISERFRFAAGLAAEFGRSRATVREWLELWLTWWRDLLLLKSGHPEFMINADREDLLEQQAEQFGLNGLREAIRRIQETMHQLEQNSNARLALEVLMLNIPTIEKEASHA
ncbi:MAG: DNA polymerase III subunit delta' [Dehalococcoidia bacterium]